MYFTLDSHRFNSCLKYYITLVQCETTVIYVTSRVSINFSQVTSGGGKGDCDHEMDCKKMLKIQSKQIIVMDSLP